MANQVLNDAKILLGQYDFSALSNEVQLTFSANMLNVTTFGQGTTINRPGLFDVAANVKGFADIDAIPAMWSDAALFGTVGLAAMPLSIAALGNAEGDRVFFVKSVNGTYQPIGGSVGDMLEFTVDLKGGGSNLVAGQLMASGAKTTTGNGTGFQRGAVAANKRIYGVLHVTAFTGITNVVVLIESAPANTFVGPTTRMTFATKTAVGWDWQESVPGAITDTWWRAKWTITGAGSCSIFCAFGVQP